MKLTITTAHTHGFNIGDELIITVSDLRWWVKILNILFLQRLRFVKRTRYIIKDKTTTTLTI